MTNCLICNKEEKVEETEATEQKTGDDE